MQHTGSKGGSKLLDKKQSETQQWSVAQHLTDVLQSPSEHVQGAKVEEKNKNVHKEIEDNNNEDLCNKTVEKTRCKV